MNGPAWRVTLAATSLMALAMGLRTAAGLFVSPLNGATGLGLATLSLLFASGQLAQGIALPFIGVWVDRSGAARVVRSGALALAAATALTTLSARLQAPSFALATLGLALAAAAVANGALGSNSLLLGEVNRRLRPEHAALAVGLVGAGGSLGQMVLGPATQAAIQGWGWNGALLASAAVALLGWPLARLLSHPRGAASARGTPEPPAAPPIAAVLRDARFWRVAASFGLCGFHVAFLAVHMPGVIERCGLPASLAGPWIALAGVANIAGSLAVGQAMRHFHQARLLMAIYAVRATGIAAYLTATPDTAVMLAFALVMGASHMATLPPTAQLVARHHGVARLSSLLGVVMLVHQVGGFAGIWLGGWAAEATGSDRALWLVDIALALVAAALVWPLRRPAGAALSAPARATALRAAPPRPGAWRA